MPTTPEQLYDNVVLTVNKQQTWVEALIFEKLGLNWNTHALAAGEHDIQLQQTYPAGDVDYDISARVFTSSGEPSEDIGFLLKERHETYFKIWVSDACVFSYFAINPKLAVDL
jgi:hypothetical protein